MTAQRMVVYVDGFNLYHGLHDWSRCRNLWLDLGALAQSLRPRNEIAKVHYFTAPVLGNSGAASRQQRYQNALSATLGDRLEIAQGRYQLKNETCKQCGHSYRRYEEKETDVSIAANIVADAASREYDAAMLISADSDMLPAVRTARLLHPKLFVIAAFPPKRMSDEIKRELPSSLHIGKAKVRAAQLPDVVTNAQGISFQRPAKWAPTTS